MARRVLLPLAVVLLAGALHAAPMALGAGETRTCAKGRYVVLGNRTASWAVHVPGRANAFREPGRGIVGTYGPYNQNGVRTTFAAVGAIVDRRCRATWYRVQLPVRPHGRTAWVRADAVRAQRLRTRIVVDLSERRVTLYLGGRPAFATRAAIGTSATPTPTGRFFVNQRLRAPDPRGPFGPVAVGISAFSPVLQGWAQGGPIAIHGTNRPWLLGQAVSHGCVRIANDAVTRLARLAPEGTPVLVRS